MTSRTKMVSLAAGMLLILALAGQALAAAQPFTDLSGVAEKEKILSLQERGLIKGVGGDRFAPRDSLTSAQGVQLIVSCLGLNIDNIRFIKQPLATDSFPKANDAAWYANALIIASFNGLELPRDLEPAQYWTREEFTHHLVLAMEYHYGLPLVKLAPAAIADEDQITIGYQGSIQRAFHYGLVKLDEAGNFRPRGEISRAEAAAAVYDALEYVAAHPVPPETGESLK